MNSPGLAQNDPGLLRLFKGLRAVPAGWITPSDFLLIGGLTVINFFTGKISISLASPDTGATLVWLPAGVSLAAVILYGPRVWSGIFLGSLLLNFSTGEGSAYALGSSAVSTAEALCAAYFAGRFTRERWTFHRTRDTLLFLLVCVLAAAVFGACGAGNAHAVRASSYWLTFATWWTGDFLGILLLTPFLVLLLGHEHHRLSLLEATELSAVLVALSVICILNFGPPVVSWVSGSGLHYLCVPLLAWVAIRFCPLEASGAALIVGGFAMWGTLHGHGMFARLLPFLGAGYVAVICSTTLGLAVAFSEKKRQLEAALRSYYAAQATCDTLLSRRPEA